MDACVDTGVALDGSARVVVMADDGGVGPALAERLAARGVAVCTITGAPAVEQVEAQLDAFLAGGTVDGIYWLPALDAEAPLEQLDLPAWREALRRRVKLLYTTARRCLAGDHAPFVVAATRLGGLHGYGNGPDEGAFAPLGGAVTGFTKAYAREHADVLVKAVDVAADTDAPTIADQLVTETLVDPGAVEIALRDGARFAIGLHEQPWQPPDDATALNADTVFVVTGAAGGIVSAIVADLAAASGGTFHLLDLAPFPDPADADVRRFASDRDALKTDIIDRLRAAGERPTPAMVERELARIERLAAARGAIDAVRGAGGEAHYHSLDLTDPAAVAAVVDDIRTRHGRVDVLVHAAGIEVSRFLADKEPREFELVFDVKSDGWFNLLHAIGDMPLGTTVVFSSVAGRFGNGGQTDYSAANDLLCKITSSFRRTRPATRGVAIDWTAWGGIGMATRGSIPKMMELAGIDMLPPEAGIPTVRRELLATDGVGEIVVGQRLGVLVEERHPSGGIDPARIDTSAAGPMVGRVVETGVWRRFAVETELDPARQPFLHDHAIDGTPILPGVMGIEAFAETARLALPGWHVAGIHDVEFAAPCKFYRNEPRTLRVEATLRRDGDDVVAACRLLASRTLVHQDEPQTTVHFTGTVRLSRAPLVAPVEARPEAAHGPIAPPDAIYRVYFHGPAFQVLDGAWGSPAGPVGRLAAALPPDHEPASTPTVAAPRLVELCFQTAGIWELASSGRMALPRHVDSVEVLGQPCNGGSVLALVHTNGSSRFDADVIDDVGHVIVRLRGYETVQLPDVPDATVLEPLRAAMS
jgi:NAD(P)-dependent dehydrogenase (short-subunit alcohol dehydrogenase family)